MLLVIFIDLGSLLLPESSTASSCVVTDLVSERQDKCQKSWCRKPVVVTTRDRLGLQWREA